MGVDGIDKADIFDEYFDDDKPKKTNWQRITEMSVDEMAEWMNKIEYECHLACSHKTDCYGYKSEEFKCLDSIKQWLLAEESEG